MEQVRVCRNCGRINSSDGTARCYNCSSFSGIITLTRPESDRLIRRHRLRFFRNRFVRLGLPLSIVMGPVIWWVVAFFSLGPTPPSPTTEVSADFGSGTWAQTRRTSQNTGFTPDQAPVSQTVKWIYDASGTLSASPAISGDRIYLTTDDGRTVALNRQTAQPVWEHSGGKPSSSTPVVAGDLVIVAFRPGLVVAVDRATGEKRWQTDLGHAIFSSPVVADGSVYVGAGDSNLHVLDAATGEERWTFATEDWIVSPVAYADGTVIVAPQNNLFYIVDANTGRKRLLFDTGRQRFGGGPTVQGDRIFTSSDQGWVWAIDRRATTYPMERTIFRIKINLWVWQVISKRPIQRGSLWVKREGGEVRGLLAVTHDTVYGVTSQGKVFALDSATGNRRWSNELGTVISTSPTVAGDTVLVGTKKGAVFGLAAATGEILWDFQVGHEIADSPIVVGDTMYVVSADGKLYAVTGDR